VLIALFEPDIPQNTGSIVRLAACMSVELHIIEPCGFPFDDKRLRRVALDYYEHATLVRHLSWQAFLEFRQKRGSRLLLMTTHASQLYTDVSYQTGDILLFGRESSGVPDYVHAAADVRLRIPLKPGTRSLNLAQSASMVVGEALRQTNGFPT
jgi:tRNA (cytidine/uridine-2'-O-)-methyltransferase